MSALSLSRWALILALTLVAAGCSQAAPAPTAAPAAAAKAAEPAKPAEPTKAPAAAPAPTQAAPAAPTAAPAKKVDFPEKNRPITIIVPYPAGGGTDPGARVLAGVLEKELGTAVQISNKAGASGQVGTTELVRSKPDGYTLATILQPATAITYINPDSKAIYTRKDIEPIAMFTADPYVVGVKSDSPYKTLKDLVDAAKAKPGELKVSTSGLLTPVHFLVAMLEQAAGMKLSPVHFDGAAPATTALLGGHVDFEIMLGTALAPHVASGAVRLLGNSDREESKFFPGVKTLQAQGYNVTLTSNTGLGAPAGTPREVIDLLSAAVKRTLDNDEVKKKLDGMTYTRRYVSGAEYAAYWEEAESVAARLLPILKK